VPATLLATDFVPDNLEAPASPEVPEPGAGIAEPAATEQEIWDGPQSIFGSNFSWGPGLRLSWPQGLGVSIDFRILETLQFGLEANTLDQKDDESNVVRHGWGTHLDWLPFQTGWIMGIAHGSAQIRVHDDLKDSTFAHQWTRLYTGWQYVALSGFLIGFDVGSQFISNQETQVKHGSSAAGPWMGDEEITEEHSSVAERYGQRNMVSVTLLNLGWLF